MNSDQLALGVVFAVILVGFVVAAGLARRVSSEPVRDGSMVEIARAIREGAVAFLHRQYGTIAIFIAIIAAVLGLTHAWLTQSVTLAVYTPLGFVLGGASSAAAGWIGVQMSIRANVRTAHASTESLDRALQVALRGGAVNALLVVCLALFGVAALYAAFEALPSPRADRGTTPLLVGYALGASTVALFAQLGGGIYTKAADIGADLAGKLDLGIPEDDPRNPAVIADLVGDNVGDCAGRGADLFESTAGECVGVMILASALAGSLGAGSVLFPLLTGALGMLASIIGTLVVRAGVHTDPMTALNRGYWLTAALAALGVSAAARWLLHTEATPDAWWHFALAGMVGVSTALALSSITEYYTHSRFAPLRLISRQSGSGAATNLLSGFSVGLECTLANALVISAAIMSAFLLGVESSVPQGGVFGIAVATSGMLAVAGYVLTMDMFGPIVDNAGGIVEMSGLSGEVRERTNRLDACGNTTKAMTKGYAMGSATLAAVVLLSAYLEHVTAFRRAGMADTSQLLVPVEPPYSIDFARPGIFVAGLLGTMLVFYFSGRAIHAVGVAAGTVIRDVRAQLTERPGIVAHGERPDYRRCVDIVTRAALRGMIHPTLVAVGLPVAVAMAFRPLHMAAEAVAAVLLSTAIGGFMLASVMNTSGAAWDNAKKFIELGAEGGRGSEAHRAAIIGDTVGDPFKDTAGPALHVLIKTVAAVALTIAPFLV